jgi:ketosteroid isomerase-like protein
MLNADKNRALIETFYRAFAQRDGATMAKCYHVDARFSDPGFPNLKGDEIGAMWRMLTSRAKEFSLSHSQVSADEHKGSAFWEANYLFSGTGRKVNNKIRASFVFKDGLILEHSDLFDFWRWARQAIGPAGMLLGWSGAFRRKVQAKARENLAAFMQKG